MKHLLLLFLTCSVFAENEDDHMKYFFIKDPPSAFAEDFSSGREEWLSENPVYPADMVYDANGLNQPPLDTIFAYFKHDKETEYQQLNNSSLWYTENPMCPEDLAHGKFLVDIEFLVPVKEPVYTEYLAPGENPL